MFMYDTFKMFSRPYNGVSVLYVFIFKQNMLSPVYQLSQIKYSQGTKVGKALTLAPERNTVRLCMAAKVILWCI